MVQVANKWQLFWTRGEIYRPFSCFGLSSHFMKHEDDEKKGCEEEERGESKLHGLIHSMQAQ